MTRTRVRGTMRFLRMGVVLALVAGGALAAAEARVGEVAPEDAPVRTTVKAFVQPRPGAERSEIAMEVESVPVDPPSVSASEARLDDDDLVLGLVIDGRAMAYPVRFLSLYEVVNDRIGTVPVTATW